MTTELVTAKYRLLVILYQLGGEASWSEVFARWRNSEISRYADELKEKGLLLDRWEKNKRIFILTNRGKEVARKILEIEEMVAQ